MFAYCNNNPIINSDPTGMLLQKDAGGGYFGGYNGGGGGGLALADPASGHIVRPTTPTSIPLFIPYIPPTTTYDLELLRTEKFDIIASFAKKDKKNKGKNTPQKPNVKYPGDDPTRAPGDDYEWRGKPNEPIGGSKGAWVNKSTGEQWHPDLNHGFPKGPHWDYTDVFGYVWSVFKDGRIIIWK